LGRIGKKAEKAEVRAFVGWRRELNPTAMSFKSDRIGVTTAGMNFLWTSFVPTTVEHYLRIIY